MKIIKIFSAVLLLMPVLFFSCSPKDSDLQVKVNEKFTASPDLMGASAAVTDGVATLTGEVQDDVAKTEAETSAKEVTGVKSVVNNLTIIPPPPPPPPPVTVNPDSILTQGVTDATKDFPTVKASVNNGEITLTGSIKRTDLQKLMQILNTLNPSKINNQLTIK